MASAPARVLHLTTTDISLELLLGPQLRAFADAGYEVIGCSAPGPYAETLAADGIRHIPLHHSTRSMALGEDLRAMREFAGVLRDVRPDVLHTHNPKPGIYGRLLGRARRVPAVVNTVHGLYATETDPLLRRSVVYSLERTAAAASHAELIQNPEDLAFLRRLRIPADRLTLLGNGVSLTRFDPARFTADQRTDLRSQLGIATDSVVIGAVSRLVREKGLPEFIDAVAAMNSSTPSRDVTVLVVGPHEPRKADALTDADVRRGEAAGIRFLGMRTDVDALYSIMDLYVLASHREGFPRSAMEAAAMGLPLVVTDIRGSRQVVDHDHNGLIVPVNDSGALRAAMEQLVADTDFRQRAGHASRERALAEFDDRRQIDITLATYERLLARSR